MDRKKTPREIETAVLVKSARRCALCFGLSQDLSEKRGQIAHLDRDPSNYTEDNLAFLCIDHHSLYDSKTSQHKNYTIYEVKAMRLAVHDAVAGNRHLFATAAPAIPAVDLDERSFFEQRSALPETPFIKQAWQLPHWRILIRPTQYMEAQFRELDDCLHFMRNRHIECPGNVPYPCIHRHFELLVDESLQVVRYELDAEGQPPDTLSEAWALFRTGQFVHTRPLPKFKQIPDSIHFLEILRVASHVFEFAKRMVAYNALEPQALISIGLRRVSGLKLYVPDRDRSSFCKTPTCEHQHQYATDLIAARSTSLAIESAMRFYNAFGWNDPDTTALDEAQKRFLIGC